jgi:ElaB/YqjD/DUF883 family membrane-anchored ribosome-binding protein
LARLSLMLVRMSPNQKKLKSGISTGSVKKVAKRVVKKAAKKTESALAVVSDRLPAGPRVVKHARATVKSLPSRTKRFVKSNPVRVLLGASAIGFVLAKLKHLV